MAINVETSDAVFNAFESGRLFDADTETQRKSLQVLGTQFNKGLLTYEKIQPHVTIISSWMTAQHIGRTQTALEAAERRIRSLTYVMIVLSLLVLGVTGWDVFEHVQADRENRSITEGVMQPGVTPMTSSETEVQALRNINENLQSLQGTVEEVNKRLTAAFPDEHASVTR
jgi:hypothetical protein